MTGKPSRPNDSPLPKVIMHDSASLDGAFTGFEYSMDLMEIHYGISGGFGDRVRLFGADTALVSIDLFGGFSEERAEDFARPRRDENLAWWAITDSRARLHGKLHHFRRSEYCRDVVVLISRQTPEEYVSYLRERNYDFIVTGTDRVDLREALQRLSTDYQAPVISLDSGRALTNALLNQGLIDEISLVIVPTIVGGGSQNLFSEVTSPQSLELIKSETFPGGYDWRLYRVNRSG